MNPRKCSVSSLTSHREFLRQSSGFVAGAAVAGAIATPGYTAEQNTVKVALIGCGGRGTGATANALQTQGPVKLWAMADAFESRLSASFNNLKEKPDQHGRYPLPVPGATPVL